MSSITGKGVGASLRRKEDARFLRGRGQFVADIRRAGMLDVAFVRSPVAHGRIGSIEKPAGLEDRVWTMADLDGVKPIRAVSALKGFKPSDLWPLARTRCATSAKRSRCASARRAQKPKTSPRRYIVDYEELPAVVDMVEARIRPPALVHDEWGDNVFLETLVDDDLSAIRRQRAITIRRHLRTARQAMSPLEGRGVVCEWIDRLGQLEVHTPRRCRISIARACRNAWASIRTQYA